ncbi:MAG: hypothetical protein K0R38_2371 [Polyangiaceae bacterium]|jgi:hypothetical protein|nr:hypothetical protein [Polyangiaceae bacterium]
MRDGNSQDLVKDTSGAIMVLGIVFGALLVGSLWHIAAIGDAMAWRERAQDAADAGAFENAVWHARGMNVIVAINIVMSLVLGVLVLWRIILILVTVALIVAAILCVVTLGTGCGFAGAVARVEARMLSKDQKLAENIIRILSAMSAAEVAVATVTPVVAWGTAASNTSGAYDVSSAATQSASLLPNIDMKTIQTLKTCFKGKSNADLTKAQNLHKQYQDFLANPRLGIGVSLPVQAESYSALCQKAGEGLMDNLAAVMEIMHMPSGAVQGIDKAKGFLGPLVGSFPGIFCAPVGASKDPPGLDDLIGKQAVESCKSQLEGARVFVGDTQGNNEIKYRDDDGKVVSEDDYVKKCTKKKSKEAKDKIKGSINPHKQYDRAECGAPAKVWEWAVNGNVFMRSFAQVEKAKTMSSRDDKGIEVADGSATGNTQALEDDDVVAHAEMYFECGDPRWMDCRSQAPWQLQWRARLRRIQPVERLVASAIEPAIVATLTQMFNGAADKYGGKLLKKMGIPEVVVPKLKDTWYFREFSRNYVQRGLYGSGAFDGVGNFIISHSDNDMTVH